MAETKADNRFKLIMLGNCDVGKTSLITRFTDNIFTPSDQESPEFDEKIKEINVDGKNVHLTITDSAGQERFRTLTSSYFRNADAIIIVYDVADAESFEDLEGHREEGQKYLGKALKVLVGNKKDLERKTSSEEGKAFADKHGFIFFETSAKTGADVETMFISTVKALISPPQIAAAVVAPAPAVAASGGGSGGGGGGKSSKSGKDKKDCILQ